jgi:hypothetical protein
MCTERVVTGERFGPLLAVLDDALGVLGRQSRRTTPRLVDLSARKV